MIIEKIHVFDLQRERCLLTLLLVPDPFPWTPCISKSSRCWITKYSRTNASQSKQTGAANTIKPHRDKRYSDERCACSFLVDLQICICFFFLSCFFFWSYLSINCHLVLICLSTNVHHTKLPDSVQCWQQRPVKDTIRMKRFQRHHVNYFQIYTCI